MKGYLLFAGESYYPRGGWYDFIGVFVSIADAQAQLPACGQAIDWAHIVDVQNQKISKDWYGEFGYPAIWREYQDEDTSG